MTKRFLWARTERERALRDHDHRDVLRAVGSGPWHEAVRARPDDRISGVYAITAPCEARFPESEKRRDAAPVATAAPHLTLAADVEPARLAIAGGGTPGTTSRTGARCEDRPDVAAACMSALPPFGPVDELIPRVGAGTPRG